MELDRLIERQEIAVQELKGAGLSLAADFLRDKLTAGVKTRPETVLVPGHDVEKREGITFVPEVFLFVRWHKAHVVELPDDSANIFLVVEVFCIDANNATILSLSRRCSDFGTNSKSIFRHG